MNIMLLSMHSAQYERKKEKKKKKKKAGRSRRNVEKVSSLQNQAGEEDTTTTNRRHCHIPDSTNNNNNNNLRQAPAQMHLAMTTTKQTRAALTSRMLSVLLIALALGCAFSTNCLATNAATTSSTTGNNTSTASQHPHDDQLTLSTDEPATTRWTTTQKGFTFNFSPYPNTRHLPRTGPIITNYNNTTTPAQHLDYKLMATLIQDELAANIDKEHHQDAEVLLQNSERTLQVLPKAEAQVASSSSGGATSSGGGGASGSGSMTAPGAASSASAMAMQANQQLAYAREQEASQKASKLNAELCRNFSIGIQNENGGAFTSPNYPNPYPLNLICTRLIEAPVGYYIVLEFRDQFNIEEAGNDCDNDKIELRDGRYGYSKVLARYCGTKFPPEVKSTNEAMWLRFISDSSISNTGFRAIYRFEKQKKCRFNVTTMSNTIPSSNNNGTAFETRTGIHSGVIRNSDVPISLLNYTKEFNVSLECIWNITVMPGWKIYLTFGEYELNKPNDCDSNFIEIYEENLTEENQTVKFCGTRTEPQQSKSNVFNIRHHAHPSAPGSRFTIIYTAFRDKGVDGCNSREFDCDDGTCIHESLKCDGQVNCKYRYDENSEPGPCPVGTENGDSFFETEHMVIILIVFLTLVSGMCASIIVSCWGKIQERRRRKLEYHIRKSREASMEGQLNKVDQIMYDGGCGKAAADGPGNKNNGNNGASGAIGVFSVNQQNTNNSSTQQTNLKHRLNASIGEHQQQNVQHQNASHLINGNRVYSSNHSSYLPASSYQQHPQLMSLANQQQMMSLDGSDSVVGVATQNYGLYNALPNTGNSSSSLDMKMELGEQVVGDVNKSLHNVQQSILANMVAQQNKQQAVDFTSLNNNKQQSVPDISQSQFKLLNSGANVNVSGSILGNETLINDAQQQQQHMLNLSLARNPSQKQQKFISSIYQSQQKHPCDNINNNNNNSNINNPYGRYTNNQQQPIYIGAGGTAAGIAGLSNISATAQTMPISLAKYNMLQAQLGNNSLESQAPSHLEAAAGIQKQQQLNYANNNGYDQFMAINDQQQQQQQNASYNPHTQRALTLSSMHQPTNLYNINQQQAQRNLQSIYGLNPLSAASNLSSSVTCCNLLGDGHLSTSNETPLIKDLRIRANQQQQQQQQRQLQQQQQQQLQHRQLVQYPLQNNRIYELRSWTMNPRMSSAAIPRSISAHQLSKSQLRQSHQSHQQQQQKQQQQQPQQKLHQQLVQQQQAQQLSYKSMSDAGHVIRHQPPNHSLSYPHACTGPHNDPSSSGAVGHCQPGESPSLPPPPPPPNLAHQARPSTSCAALPPGSVVAANQQQQQQHVVDSRRAAFKVSRLDPSQLTGDTLQDPDLMLNVANLPFTDEPSTTESDATFGMLMNSIGNTSLKLSGLPSGMGVGGGHHLVQQQQQPGATMFLSGGQNLKAGQPQVTMLAHMNECNLIRAQQSNHLIANQPIMCNCGALERANQHQQQQRLLQQQQQLHQSSHEFDDSDDLPYMMQQHHQQHQQISPSTAKFTEANLDLLQPAQANNLEVVDNMILTQNVNPARFKQHLQHSNNGFLYGGQMRQQQQQQYARFRHQSSELTADDDDEDEEDLDGYHVEPDEDEDEDEADDISISDGAAAATAQQRAIRRHHKQQQQHQLPPTAKSQHKLSTEVPAAPPSPPPPINDIKLEYRTNPNTNSKCLVTRNEEQLRDGPTTAPASRHHLSGSHTSISCQSCTCGSQLQLDQLGSAARADESNSSSGSSNGGNVVASSALPAPLAVDDVKQGCGEKEHERQATDTNTSTVLKGENLSTTNNTRCITTQQH